MSVPSGRAKASQPSDSSEFGSARRPELPVTDDEVVDEAVDEQLPLEQPADAVNDDGANNAAAVDAAAVNSELYLTIEEVGAMKVERSPHPRPHPRPPACKPSACNPSHTSTHPHLTPSAFTRLASQALTSTPLHPTQVKQLREALSELGLDTSGRKDELIERLVIAISAGPAASTPQEPAAEATAEEHEAAIEPAAQSEGATEDATEDAEALAEHVGSMKVRGSTPTPPWLQRSMLPASRRASNPRPPSPHRTPSPPPWPGVGAQASPDRAQP